MNTKVFWTILIAANAVVWTFNSFIMADWSLVFGAERMADSFLLLGVLIMFAGTLVIARIWTTRG